jgi:predicted ATPase
MLIVLDNLEQVIGVAPVLAGLLASVPRMKVIATSRTPLRISGERTYALKPMALDESVRLFSERARATSAEFSVTQENEEAVAEICSRLEGLPLAIELAASRVRHADPAGAPTAPRPAPDAAHRRPTGSGRAPRTLRGTIEWSS